jgi:hypothetical protein
MLPSLDFLVLGLIVSHGYFLRFFFLARAFSSHLAMSAQVRAPTRGGVSPLSKASRVRWVSAWVVGDIISEAAVTNSSGKIKLFICNLLSFPKEEVVEGVKPSNPGFPFAINVDPLNYHLLALRLIDWGFYP